MKDIEKLNYRPFTRFCMSIGAVPSSYLASLTIEEQLLWLCSYLEKEVIPAVNNNAEAVEELQNLFTELQTYVNNYFDNLDVQEEINNKLDEMAESGELEEIIGAYLNSKAIFGFDTVSEMKNATNLINGSYAKTLGYHFKNDGGSALYKIRNITNDDVIDERFIIEMNDSSNQLVAELIYGDEIKVEQLGAYGDGTHDDTATIQSAINKNKVTILSKTYKITDSLTVDIGYNKGINGEGIAKILSDFSNGEFNSIRLINSLYTGSGGLYGTSMNFVLKNIILTEINEANDTYATHYGSGICLDNGCNNAKIDNLKISNFKYAIYGINTAHGVYLNKFENIQTDHNDYGIYLNLNSANDCGENFSFNQCCFASSKLGNMINNNNYVNFTNCSFDYNLGNTFIVKDSAQVNLSNCHIEWYHSTPLIDIYYSASIKFIGCTFLKGNFDDGITPTNMIQASLGGATPEILFDGCCFLMNRTYNKLCNLDGAWIKIINSNRYEYTPSTFMQPYDIIKCENADNYKYPLNYQSGLTRNSTKVKVTCTTVNANNRIILPIEYQNKDALITMKLNSSIDLNFSIKVGSGKILGEGILERVGEIEYGNQSLAASNDKTITIYHKFRKGLGYNPYIQFNLANLTQGATFEVKEIGLQII